MSFIICCFNSPFSIFYFVLYATSKNDFAVLQNNLSYSRQFAEWNLLFKNIPK